MNMYEVAIVGAGPIGLELAVALKKLNVSCAHFDAGQVGQTVTWYPQQVRFFSSPERIAIAGVPLQTVDQGKATREEYLAYLRSIVQMFDLQINTFEKVLQIDHATGGGFKLTTERAGSRHQYHVRHVVLALGDMHEPRLLGIPGEDLPHVSHYFHEAHRYFRKRLLIVGGRNSAVEAALRCYHAGAQVSISYRQEQFDERSVKYWLLPELKMLIRTHAIEFLPGTVPTAITPSHVSIAPAGGGPARDLAFDFVLLLVGYRMNPVLFEKAGVALEGENQAPVFDERTMQTNMPGIYVAGTAAAGTQNRFRLFIENCHSHVQKIVKAITGQTIRTPDTSTGPSLEPRSGAELET